MIRLSLALVCCSPAVVCWAQPLDYSRKAQQDAFNDYAACSMISGLNARILPADTVTNPAVANLSKGLAESCRVPLRRYVDAVSRANPQVDQQALYNELLRNEGHLDEQISIAQKATNAGGESRSDREEKK